MTAILPCKPSCKNAYQDSVYGLGNRCYNKTKQNEGKLYKCSVCGETKGVNLTAEEAKKLSKKGK